MFQTPLNKQCSVDSTTLRRFLLALGTVDTSPSGREFFRRRRVRYGVTQMEVSAEAGWSAQAVFFFERPLHHNHSTRAALDLTMALERIIAQMGRRPKVKRAHR